MEFPDVDHFFQEGGKLPRMSQVIPFTFWDLFRWELRTEYFSFTFLHYWAYPFILLVLLAVPLAWPKGTRWIIFGMFLGWTTHLALDGVMLFM